MYSYGKKSSYSVVFVCRGWRRWWWICQWPPGASQVLGAWVVGWHCPPLTAIGKSTSIVRFSERPTRYRYRFPQAAVTQMPMTVLTGNPQQQQLLVYFYMCISVWLTWAADRYGKILPNFESSSELSHLSNIQIKMKNKKLFMLESKIIMISSLRMWELRCLMRSKVQTKAEKFVPLCCLVMCFPK